LRQKPHALDDWVARRSLNDKASSGISESFDIGCRRHASAAPAHPRGVTVVLTTHEPASIDQCDRVVFLARDGHLAFTGSPTDARRYFEVNDVAEVYVRLSVEHTPQIWAKRFADIRGEFGDRPVPARYPLAATRSDVERASAIRQWWLLTRRNVDVLFRNRLTLAVLLGSPVLVTAMMATVFNRGAFEPHSAADLAPAQIVFWVAFAGFFFGLTYGLLQIVGEMAVFRRERLAGLSVGAYVASKVTALLPVLAGVSAVLLGVLRVLGRLPAVGWHVLDEQGHYAERAREGLMDFLDDDGEIDPAKVDAVAAGAWSWSSASSTPGSTPRRARCMPRCSSPASAIPAFPPSIRCPVSMRPISHR
jgi:hypothetical protein